MILRAKLLGFACGAGLVVASYTAGVMATDIPSAALTERSVLIYIVGPGAMLLFAVIGWFSRGAYASLSQSVQRIEDRLNEIPKTYATKEELSDAKREWSGVIDRLIAQRDREMDLLARVRANGGTE